MSNKHTLEPRTLLIRFCHKDPRKVLFCNVLEVSRVNRIRIIYSTQPPKSHLLYIVVKLNYSSKCHDSSPHLALTLVYLQNDLSNIRMYKKCIPLTFNSFSIASLHFLEIHIIKIVIKSTLKPYCCFVVCFWVIFHT